MNELSYDQLLKIEYNHPISCPEINPLKFTGEMSSRIYEIDLEYDPSHLKVSTSSLVDVINRLDSWTTGILDKYNQLPPKLTVDINVDVSFITESLEVDYINDIKEYAGEINSLINSWIDYRNDYIAFGEDIKNINFDIEQSEKYILLGTLKSQSDIDDKKEYIEYLKQDLEEVKEKQDDIKHYFKRYVEEDFIKQTTEFSNFLEVVRERNDNLRSLVTDLKREVIFQGNELFELYQPTDFLEARYPAKDKEINLGIFFNDAETENRTQKTSYFNMIKRLSNKGTVNISFNEKEDLMDLFDKHSKKEIINKVLDFLKSKGINVVRYYPDQHSYLEDKNSFVQENLNKQKLKTNKLM